MFKTVTSLLVAASMSGVAASGTEPSIPTPKTPSPFSSLPLPLKSSPFASPVAPNTSDLSANSSIEKISDFQAKALLKPEIERDPILKSLTGILTDLKKYHDANKKIEELLAKGNLSEVEKNLIKIDFQNAGLAFSNLAKEAAILFKHEKVTSYNPPATAGQAKNAQESVENIMKNIIGAVEGDSTKKIHANSFLFSLIQYH